jgi:hypothetical protein
LTVSPVAVRADGHGRRLNFLGVVVPLFEQRAHDGRWGSVSSDGRRIPPTRDGGVEIYCPAVLSEI